MALTKPKTKETTHSWYRKQLADPRWKAKRLEILERDQHKCTRCGAVENLQVHHKEYEGLPWEVANEYLITLCNSCHFIIEGKHEPNKSLPEYKFVKSFITGAPLLRQCTKQEYDIVFLLLQFMTYSNEITLVRHRKQKIAEILCSTPNSVMVAISKIVKKGVLIKVGGGLYKMNTKIFSKGSEKNPYGGGVEHLK